ncbi:MAG: ABC transporter permease [Gammaproteobacteria bacterium]|nr:ABC transporter permease [Gammaproteobacteria bacterium]
MKTITRINIQRHLLGLAWKEFWRSFKRFGEFFWLSVFMALILSFALLIKGSSEGLKSQFVDILLGRVGDHGISIWVRPNPFRQGFQRFLDPWVLDQVRQLDREAEEGGIPGISIHPYRLVDNTVLGLPADGEQNATHSFQREAEKNEFFSKSDNGRGQASRIWRSVDESDPFEIRFQGIAVYEEDPLWQTLSKGEPASGLVLILNRGLLREEGYFNYAAYLEALKNRLPKPLFRELPASAAEFFSDAFHGPLWLEVSGSQKRELLPMRIIWTDRIPVPEKFAYLFPMSAFHALREGHSLAGLRIFPEADLDDVESRARKIGLKKRLSFAQISQFAQCVDTPLSWGNLSTPIPKDKVTACASKVRLTEEDYTVFHEPKEDGSQGKLPISRVKLNKTDIPYARVKKFARCLDRNTTLPSGRSWVHIAMDPPKPKAWVKACARQASISDAGYRITVPAGGGDSVIQEKGEISWVCADLSARLSRLPLAVQEFCRAHPDETISKPAYILQVPCQKLFPGELEQSEEERRLCETEPEGVIRRPVTHENQGYMRAFVYIAERRQLSNAITALNELADTPLHLHPLYLDALTRFSALVEILDALGGPYMWLGFLFVLILIWVQMTTLAGHRRHYYGIFLAKGMSRRQIFFMLFFQTSLTTLIGAVPAYAAIEFTRGKVLDYYLLPKAEKFKAVLELENLNLLPLTGWDHIQLMLFTLVLVLGITGIILWRSGLDHYSTPANLLGKNG